MFQLVDAGSVDAGTKVLVPVISANEYCRDADDVIGILIEKHKTGVFVPVRRAGSTIERVEQVVIATVTPASDPVYEKVHVASEGSEKGGE